jgi:hypothetical protein
MPQPLYPWKDPVSIVQRLGGPQGWSVLNLAPLGFNPWTIRPAASRYTDYTILAHKFVHTHTHTHTHINIYIYIKPHITEILEIVGYGQNEYIHSHIQTQQCSQKRGISSGI